MLYCNTARRTYLVPSSLWSRQRLAWQTRTIWLPVWETFTHAPAFTRPIRGVCFQVINLEGRLR